jgi:hypothetical protein
MPENLKTVELRGGALHGKRATAPVDATQLNLPVDGNDKFTAWIVYRHTSDRCADGTEVWEEYIESQWGDTGLTDL